MTASTARLIAQHIELTYELRTTLDYHEHFGNAAYTKYEDVRVFALDRFSRYLEISTTKYAIAIHELLRRNPYADFTARNRLDILDRYIVLPLLEDPTFFSELDRRIIDWQSRE